jgi:LysR family nitrogen assimilation transcriptional regulator
MELRLLEYFLRVSELKSISRAAVDLSLSQSALSRHMGALEYELNAVLLHRTSAGILLTDAGAELVERARSLLQASNELREEVGARALGRLNLAMPMSMQRSVTVPLVAETIAEEPDIRIRVYEGLNNAIRDNMRNGVPDLAVVAFAPEPFALYEETPLLREQLFLVGDLGSPLDLDRFVMPTEMTGLKMILPGRPNVIRQLCESYLRRNDDKYHSRAEAETLALCLDLVGRGLGHTVMPFCALQNHPDRARFHAAPIRGMMLTWVLAVNRHRVNARATKIVLRRLLSLIEVQVESGLWRGAELTTQAREMMHRNGH